MYDFTEKVLGMQRDFTKKLIATSTEAADKGEGVVRRGDEVHPADLVAGRLGGLRSSPIHLKLVSQSHGSGYPSRLRPK
jgi:hypothetical protein